jgi:hypothetical protein
MKWNGDIPTNHALPEVDGNTLQGRGYIAQELLLSILLVADYVPELAWLLEVLVGDDCGERCDLSRPILVRGDPDSLREGYWLDAGEDVVRIPAVVPIHGAWAISHVRRVYVVMGSVGRQLEVVWADSVAMRIRIAEHSCLEN